MIIELINLILVFWSYLYLIKLYKTGCECAMSPNYYFLVFYLTISILLLFAGIIDGIEHILAVMAVIYFVMSVIFVFATFGYINELESKHCKCADDIGKEVLQILAWLRIIVFAVSIVLVGFLLSIYNKFNLKSNVKSNVKSMKSLKSMKKTITS